MLREKRGEEDACKEKREEVGMGREGEEVMVKA